MPGDIIYASQEVTLTDETTGYKCNPDINGNLPVVAGQTGAWAVGVTGLVTANQGTPGATSAAWPIKITDGTTVAGVDVANALYVSGKSAAGVAPSSNPVCVSGIDAGGLKRILKTDTLGRLATLIFDGAGNAINSTLANSNRALDVALHSGNIASYAASTNGVVLTGTALNTVQSIGYLWHPASVTKRYEISKIFATITSQANNAGNLTLNCARITAENGTPGGVPQSVNPFDSADEATGATFRTSANAPTRLAGDFSAVGLDGTGGSQAGSANQYFVLFDENLTGKPMVCRASVAEGIEIRSVVLTALTTSMRVAVSFYWREV